MDFIDLKRQYKKYKEEINSAVKEVMESASFILGEKVLNLEKRFSEYVGSKFALAVSSGTDALLIALMAYGVKKGDEIITSPFTFIATAEVIALLGATPVFADVDERTFNISPENIKEKITKNTKGIIAVDIFGEPADYDEIRQISREKGLFLIEDAAQAFGSMYKGRKTCSLGDVSCTSFFPAKPLGCYGDGGMIFTDNENLFEVMKSIRVHGQGRTKYENERLGINGRLDAIQAAVLSVKFKYFEDEIDKRIKIANRYKELLNDRFMFQETSGENRSVYAQFCIIPKDKNREYYLEKLRREGIPYAIYYPIPLHLMKSFSYLGYKKNDFPVSEKLSESIFALPMHPFLTEEEQNKIIGVLKK